MARKTVVKEGRMPEKEDAIGFIKGEIARLMGN